MIEHEILRELKHVFQVFIQAVSGSFLWVILRVSFAICDKFPRGLSISLKDLLNKADETTAPPSISIAVLKKSPEVTIDIGLASII